MKLYFAPLEGVTNYVYRNIHAEFFGHCDGYFSPFIVPSDNEKVNLKGLKDVLKENNRQDVKVQVLTKDASDLIKFAKKIQAAGYDEINLNLGCPYPTVVKKGRGAGFLVNPAELDNFFEEFTSSCDIKLSVKTRAGFYSADELDNLMNVYNKYKLTCLIIHPRAREDFYNGVPDMNSFQRAYEVSENPLCYNGNIFEKQDYENILNDFPNLDSVMIGRGAVANPAIFREIKGGEKLKTQELVSFTEKLIEMLRETLRSDVFTLHKIKELWTYMIKNYPDEKKIAKALKKANNISDFSVAIKSLPEIKI